MKKQNGITLIALIITIIVMLILVGVTINVVINGGLLTTAEKAATGMSMAQIKERAEVIKYTLMADLKSENDVTTGVVQEYKERLQEEFGADNVVIVGNRVTVDGKYDIIIKNTDLDIEVTEYLDRLGVPITLGITKNNEENKVTLIFNLSAEQMTEEEYISKIENATPQQKKIAIEDYLYAETNGEVTTLDEYLLFVLNDGYNKDYTSIDQYLTDTDILSAFGKTEGSITEEQLFYYTYTGGKTDGIISEEEVISYYFEELFGGPSDMYEAETEDFKVFINGEQIATISDITALDDLVYDEYRTGTCEIVVKNAMRIVAIERLEIKTSNKYVLTKEQANGIWETDGNGSITKYLGEESIVYIPAYIGEEKITIIDNFGVPASVKEIRIPNSVTKIGNSAFSECTGLTKITIPDSVTDLGWWTFSGCTSLKDVVLSNKITELGTGVFESCSSLEKITIPNSVTSIRARAFEDCIALKEIRIPDLVTSIGQQAFINCTSLTKINIPDLVTSVEYETFRDCKSLTNITVGESVTIIGMSAFNGCSSLKAIAIPNSVITIKEYAFGGCSDITITFEEGPNSVPSGFDWGAENATLIDLNDTATGTN